MRLAPHPETLRLILADYRRHEAVRRYQADWWTADDLPREDAARRAGLGLVDGHLHSHQRRPGAAVMRQVAEQVVLQIDWLAEAKTFRALHARIARVLSVVASAGELVIYDTTDRLAYHLGLEPDAVHLHRGTRVGARRLGLAGCWLDVHQLPDCLSTLRPREAEDVLCTYKDDFLKEPDAFRLKLATRVRGCWSASRRGRC